MKCKNNLIVSILHIIVYKVVIKNQSTVAMHKLHNLHFCNKRCRWEAIVQLQAQSLFMPVLAGHYYSYYAICFGSSID